MGVFYIIPLFWAKNIWRYENNVITLRRLLMQQRTMEGLTVIGLKVEHFKK